MAQPLLEVRGLTTRFRTERGKVTAVDDVSFSVNAGQTLAIVGESGSGKSTLLHLLGGLDRATSGRILFEDIDIAQYSAAQLADYRNRRVGFVWQIHHLLPEFTAAENIAMPLLIRGVVRAEARQTALAQLDRVGLAERAHHRSGELSGGEQQRVVLARALAGDPALLLADEPTGNLDTRTGERIFDLLDDLHFSRTLTMVLVTHNRQFASRCDRVLLLQNGILLPA